MSFNFRIEQVSGRGLPVRALLFTGSGEWTGSDGYLFGLDGRLLFRDLVISEPIRVSAIHLPENPRARLWTGQRLGLELVAALSDSAFQFIEDTRGTDDLIFRVELRYQWQDAVKGNGQQYISGAANWREGPAHFPPVARSRWTRLLADMKWTEVELFEVRTAPFTHFENLPTAVTRLRDAEKALRNGDWNGVLAHCRAALEAAAKSHARSDDLKQGFELLFDAAVPEHNQKRTTLDSFVKALSAYAHFGRHESYPAIQITRSEAEFVYTTTLGLFSFLGRRLSKLETLSQ